MDKAAAEEKGGRPGRRYKKTKLWASKVWVLFLVLTLFFLFFFLTWEALLFSVYDIFLASSPFSFLLSSSFPPFISLGVFVRG